MRATGPPNGYNPEEIEVQEGGKEFFMDLVDWYLN